MDFFGSPPLTSEERSQESILVIYKKPIIMMLVGGILNSIGLFIFICTIMGYIPQYPFLGTTFLSNSISLIGAGFTLVIFIQQMKMRFEELNKPEDPVMIWNRTYRRQNRVRTFIRRRNPTQPSIMMQNLVPTSTTTRDITEATTEV